ncbi:hypothetical protein ERC79_02490 [Rhodococcus sp. ABRD24]|uniref:hypothetical protein n=1 Tax=Rhodococcus sp. ABRD24 TaxID=2507582 RepID=UPI00103AAFE0|nr:hypothetical protein [Rhodococcus sp. ABRD24]QBJ94956.1 hypothetical protein ERC79_02490 [Rhodococcus sp. ABRD24]
MNTSIQIHAELSDQLTHWSSGVSPTPSAGGLPTIRGSTHALEAESSAETSGSLALLVALATR